jgi:hypothetical protein
MSKYPALAFLTLLAASQTWGSDAAAKPAAGQLQLWYRQPAAQWVEALPVGNGRLGLPSIAAPLDVWPEVTAVTEHASQDESGRGGHGPAVVARFVPMLALHSHRFGQRAFPPSHRHHRQEASIICGVTCSGGFCYALLDSMRRGSPKPNPRLGRGTGWKVTTTLYRSQ